MKSSKGSERLSTNLAKLARASDLLMTYLAKLEMAVISAKYGQQ